jgi:hypothetical protein
MTVDKVSFLQAGWTLLDRKPTWLAWSTILAGILSDDRLSRDGALVKQVWFGGRNMWQDTTHDRQHTTGYTETAIERRERERYNTRHRSSIVDWLRSMINGSRVSMEGDVITSAGSGGMTTWRSASVYSGWDLIFESHDREWSARTHRFCREIGDRRVESYIAPDYIRNNFWHVFWLLGPSIILSSVHHNHAISI